MCVNAKIKYSLIFHNEWASYSEDIFSSCEFLFHIFSIIGTYQKEGLLNLPDRKTLKSDQQATL